MSSKAASDKPWWKEACIYQIYPSSFNSANGGTVGDLQGIIDKLPYLKSIGVDCVWLVASTSSPHFESPNYDYGYDISNYQLPDSRYGTAEQVDELIEKTHALGMKIIFDLVINHTSHQHPWFIESRKSKDNPYRKYYHWRRGRKDAQGNRIPPTNWRAVFGGSVWQYDKLTDEYYLHYFLKEQPDLNWESPEVRQHIYEEAVLFWLRKGLDGFRVDASTMYSKRPFEDFEITSPDTYDQPAHGLLDQGPNMAKYLQELTEQTFAKFDAVTIAECGGKLSLEKMLENVARKQGKFCMAIGFDILNLDHDPEYVFYPRKWTLSEVKEKIILSQQLAEPHYDAWTPNYLENHDHGRSVSRFGDDSPRWRGPSAKMLALYLVTLSGTLLMYQGQEIGMTNLPESVPLEEYIDPASQNYWRDVCNACEAGNEKYNKKDAMKGLQKVARDHSRTPFQWSGEANAGFTTNDKPWMLVNPNYTEVNAAQQEKDPNSVLNFWRKALAFRKEHSPVLVDGTFHLLQEDDPNVLTYIKRSLDSKEEIVVLLNWSGKKQPVQLPDSKATATLLISTIESPEPDFLQPWEGRAYTEAAQ